MLKVKDNFSMTLPINNINYWMPTITFIEKFPFSFAFDAVHIFAIPPPPFVHYVRIKLLLLWSGFLGSRGSEHYHRSGKGKQPSEKRKRNTFMFRPGDSTVVSLFFSAQIQYPFYLHESIASHNPSLPDTRVISKFNIVPSHNVRDEVCRVHTRLII